MAKAKACQRVLEIRTRRIELPLLPRIRRIAGTLATALPKKARRPPCPKESDDTRGIQIIHAGLIVSVAHVVPRANAGRHSDRQGDGELSVDSKECDRCCDLAPCVPARDTVVPGLGG